MTVIIVVGDGREDPFAELHAHLNYLEELIVASDTELSAALDALDSAVSEEATNVERALADLKAAVGGGTTNAEDLQPFIDRVNASVSKIQQVASDAKSADPGAAGAPTGDTPAPTGDTSAEAPAAEETPAPNPADGLNDVPAGGGESASQQETQF